MDGLGTKGSLSWVEGGFPWMSNIWVLPSPSLESLTPEPGHRPPSISALPRHLPRCL